jgi:protein-tyrosine phosphatase
MGIVGFPDGTRVRASSISDRRVDDHERTFGLYLDAHWEPTWPATVIDWEDFGLPENPELAAQQIADAFARARRGGLVEVGCRGGSGRTGTVLACMAVLAGVPRAQAVAWVRASYRPEAVETVDQEAWVQWFAEWMDAHPEASASHAGVE